MNIYARLDDEPEQWYRVKGHNDPSKIYQNERIKIIGVERLVAPTHWMSVNVVGIETSKDLTTFSLETANVRKNSARKSSLRTK